MSVKPKKHLGQHFLTDDSISFKIADSLKCEDQDAVLEIGPGTGVLTRFLVEENYDLLLCEIDGESVEYLHENFPELKNKILHQDFLQKDLSKDFSKPIHIIGNFPYNISNQIFNYQKEVYNNIYKDLLDQKSYVFDYKKVLQLKKEIEKFKLL